jgi:hypothetical protein
MTLSSSLARHQQEVAVIRLFHFHEVNKPCPTSMQGSSGAWFLRNLALDKRRRRINFGRPPA